MNQYPSSRVREALERTRGTFDSFDAADWYDMALACLDQAGMRVAGWTDPGVTDPGVNMPGRTQRKKKIVDPVAVAGESTPEGNK